jgi:hypothetical protein
MPVVWAADLPLCVEREEKRTRAGNGKAVHTNYH